MTRHKNMLKVREARMSRIKIIQSIAILFILIFLSLAALWLAGFLFFVLMKTNPLGKTNLTTWWTYWQAYQHVPHIVKHLRAALLAAALISYVVPCFIAIVALRERRALHGDARFAHAAEIKQSGLLGNNGIIIGKWRNRFLMFPGLQFVLLAAATRTGKGVGVVIPNLLNWKDSVVTLDVKLENFLITSKYRAAHGSEVYLFNPFCITPDKDLNPLHGKTHRYNPLEYISDDPHIRITDIISISYSLYPGEGKEAFFDDAARNLFLGLTLYLLETPHLPKTLGELLRQSSGKGKPIRTHLEDCIRERKSDAETKEQGTSLPPLSNECIEALQRFTSTSDNTLSSILATFNVPLTLWASPMIDAATSSNDFDLRQLRKKRMSIYIGIPANRLAESKLLLNVFYTQLINLNTHQLLNATPEVKYPVLLLNDEFTAPGRINIIDKSNAYLAGYGLKLLTIIQSMSQLSAPPPKGYGKEGARTFITNHACQILYTPREQREANEYSEMLGYYTFKAKGKSRQIGINTNKSESESDQRRALMMPQELKELPLTKQIISLEDIKPIRCDKICYYKDVAFIERLKFVSPTLKRIKHLPNQKQLENAISAGELIIDIPPLNMDLHEARLEKRTRALTSKDIEKSIDLNTLTADFSKITIDSDAETLSPESVETFVNDFFDAIEAAR